MFLDSLFTILFMNTDKYLYFFLSLIHICKELPILVSFSQCKIGIVQKALPLLLILVLLP